MAAQYAGTEISIDRFSWNPETLTFVVWMRTPDGQRAPVLFQRVYPDAADVGFPMRTSATGKSAWFVFSHADCNADEIAGWNFVPSPEAVAANPKLEGVTVLVIND